MPILQLTVNQRLANQLIVNRYHYVSSGTPAAVSLSFALMHASGYLTSRIVSGVFPAGTLARQIQEWQGTSLQYISAYAQDIYSNTDFYESPFPSAPNGQRGNDTMSPAVAFGFSASRVRTDIRRGQKRIAGVCEVDVVQNGVIESTTLGNLAGVAAKLAAVLTYDDEGNTISFTPAVLGLQEYTSPSGKRAYRPYPTESQQLSHVATGMTWSPYTTLRTQVSRQYGRGA